MTLYVTVYRAYAMNLNTGGIPRSVLTRQKPLTDEYGRFLVNFEIASIPTFILEFLESSEIYYIPIPTTLVRKRNLIVTFNI